ncbi:MAG: HPF/RaiA family ribosome-associated protein [Bdellovibrionaceae bacterium]|nr:HPF/RaiA family ribosome-associated protein [Pseudobdellovibrionaceae bacterium]
MNERRRQQLHELPLELRAYINQQVSTLTPFCLPDSRAAVTVIKEVDKNGQEEFVVTVSLCSEGTEVKSTSSSDNMYEATRRACETLLEHLNRIHSEIVDEMETKEQVQQSANSNEEVTDDDSNDGEDSGGGKAVCH